MNVPHTFQHPHWILRCVASSSRHPTTPLRSGVQRRCSSISIRTDWRTLETRTNVNYIQSNHSVKLRYRSISSSTVSGDEEASEPPRSKNSAASSSSTSIRNRLSPVLEALPGDIDWGVAYGSGVIQQANASSTSPPPLTDFLLSTSDPVDFHIRNIEKHPSHYPIYARLIGGGGVAWIQESLGAGVWYVTNVHLEGMEVKYGVISTLRLRKDLEEWATLYVAGRLHKPVLPLRSDPSLRPSLEQNLKAALSLALLRLPDRFTEMELWEEIAGISYSGDPRMIVPGAENPQKVKNIVRGPGVLNAFREMYGDMLSQVSDVRWNRTDQDSLREKRSEWVGKGETTMVQSSSAENRLQLFYHLPRRLRESVLKQLSSERFEETVQSDQFKKILSTEVGKIIRGPALTQSFKGLLTAGPVKSFWYGLAKVRKWWAGRAKRETKSS